MYVILFFYLGIIDYQILAPAWYHDIKKVEEKIVPGNDTDKLKIPDVKQNSKLAIRLMINANAPQIQMNCEDVKATVRALV